MTFSLSSVPACLDPRFFEITLGAPQQALLAQQTQAGLDGVDAITEACLAFLGDRLGT
jgi:hypothetical protein